MGEYWTNSDFRRCLWTHRFRTKEAARHDVVHHLASYLTTKWFRKYDNKLLFEVVCHSPTLTREVLLILYVLNLAMYLVRVVALLVLIYTRMSCAIDTNIVPAAPDVVR